MSEARLRGLLPDAIAAVTLATLVGVGLWRWTAAGSLPAEDAAMLLRYAGHLAEGHGIVWNIGEPPVDGATDFLYMVLVAAGAWLGVGLERSAQLLNAVAHVVTVGGIYVVGRRLHGAGTLLGFGAAAWVALGPAYGYIDAAFGAPVFALALGGAYVCAEACKRAPSSQTRAVLFALTCLVAGLIRPEGVLVAGFLLVVLVRAVGRRAGRIVWWFLSIMGGLGLIYFLWRWAYFGQPLPNPYYRKGGGRLHLSSLRASIEHTIRFTWPFIPLYVLCLRSRDGVRAALFSGVPLVLFVGMWVLVSGEMNYLGRFQYPALVLAALAAPGLIRPLRAAWSGAMVRPGGQQVAAVAAATAMLAVLGGTAGLPNRSAPNGPEIRFRLAQVLHSFSDRGYLLTTTEAGRIPLYSQWDAVDAWGLNDQWIARAGGITEVYLVGRDPDVIILHEHLGSARVSPLGPEWDEMTRTLTAFAKARGDVLALARPEEANSRIVVYVRAELPDRAALQEALGDLARRGG